MFNVIQSLFDAGGIEGFAPRINIGGFILSDVSLIKITIAKDKEQVIESGELHKPAAQVLLASSAGETQAIELPSAPIADKSDRRLVASAVLPYRLHPFYSFGSEAVQAPPIDFVLADRLRFYVPKPLQTRIVELQFFSDNFITLEFQTSQAGIATDGSTEYQFRVAEPFLVRNYRCEVEQLPLDNPIAVPVLGSGLLRIESSSFASAFHLKATHDIQPDQHHIVAFI